MMTRRAWIATSVGLALTPSAPAQTTAQSLLKPKVLKPGDRIGLITPSSYVSNPESILLAEKTLRFFGLEPKLGRHVRKRDGYLGGSAAERVADLHEMFADASVQGIFCIRGGFGSAHLLDSIDYGLIRRNPKVFLGYSDITALHLAIHRHTGLVTFHGPVPLSRFTPYTQQHFRKVLFETKPAGVLTNPPDSDPLRPEHTLRTIRPGRVSAPLAGGNLTLISTTLGTPYEIDTRGRILFLEDVDEQPYSIDRMLTHLKLAGKLDAAAGIVWGECADCRPREFRPSFESNFSVPEIIDRILGSLKVPVLSGLTIGHTNDQLTLPIGVRATLDADRGTLSLDESPFAG